MWARQEARSLVRRLLLSSRGQMVVAETSVGTVEAVGFWIFSAGEAQGMGR